MKQLAMPRATSTIVEPNIPTPLRDNPLGVNMRRLHSPSRWPKEAVTALSTFVLVALCP